MKAFDRFFEKMKAFDSFFVFRRKFALCQSGRMAHNYTHCAYGKPSYLFYGSSVIMSEDGTQQGNPEAPALLRKQFIH